MFTNDLQTIQDAWIESEIQPRFHCSIPWTSNGSHSTGIYFHRLLRSSSSIFQACWSCTNSWTHSFNPYKGHRNGLHSLMITHRGELVTVTRTIMYLCAAFDSFTRKLTSPKPKVNKSHIHIYDPLVPCLKKEECILQVVLHVLQPKYIGFIANKNYPWVLKSRLEAMHFIWTLELILV